jgi:hypothetical protein
MLSPQPHPEDLLAIIVPPAFSCSYWWGLDNSSFTGEFIEASIIFCCIALPIVSLPIGLSELFNYFFQSCFPFQWTLLIRRYCFYSEDIGYLFCSHTAIDHVLIWSSSSVGGPPNFMPVPSAVQNLPGLGAKDRIIHSTSAGHSRYSSTWNSCCSIFSTHHSIMSSFCCAVKPLNQLLFFCRRSWVEIIRLVLFVSVYMPLASEPLQWLWRPPVCSLTEPTPLHRTAFLWAKICQWVTNYFFAFKMILPWF